MELTRVMMSCVKMSSDDWLCKNEITRVMISCVKLSSDDKLCAVAKADGRN